MNEIELPADIEAFFDDEIQQGEITVPMIVAAKGVSPKTATSVLCRLEKSGKWEMVWRRDGNGRRIRAWRRKK